MDYNKEKQEARQAIQTALTLINQCQSDVKSAKKWGIVDIIGGGALISLVKRNKINKINQNLTRLENEFKKVNSELSDIGGIIDFKIPDSFAADFFDIAFDNIFTDITTQSHLSKTEKKLDEWEEVLSRILDKL